MSEILFAIVIICFMAGLFLTWSFVHKAKVKERLLLIEKGVDVSNLPKNGKFKFIFPWLKLGIIITSASFGILLGLYLRELKILPSGIGEGLPLIFPYFFGGFGMILAYFIDKPKEQK
jgi:hypothetical protein